MTSASLYLICNEQLPLQIIVRKDTVNVVIFGGGGISRKCLEDLSHGGYFHDTSPFSIIKSYGFYFTRGINFRKEANISKNAKITLTRKSPCLQ